MVTVVIIKQYHQVTLATDKKKLHDYTQNVATTCSKITVRQKQISVYKNYITHTSNNIVDCNRNIK
jgi:thiamine phosphate synthase YjbQ (UPF0047 family)